MTFRRRLQSGRRLAGAIRDRVRDLFPARRAAQLRNMAMRDAALRVFDDFSRRTAGESAAHFSSVVVDGTWDNANYWMRYALLRRALGLAGTSEAGLLGEHQRARVSTAFDRLGIADRIDFGALRAEKADRLLARNMVNSLADPSEILDWSLPGGMPATRFYDGVLKRQRRAVVDVRDPMLPDYLADAICWIRAACQLFDSRHVDLVVMSHSLDYTRGAVVWEALRRGIPVIVIYGDFGTLRFLHLRQPHDLFNYPGRPTRAEFDAMPRPLAVALAQSGREYLHARLGGNTNDVSAIYAFQRSAASVDRQSLCARYGWNAQRPIIAVYAPNWFDYPHMTGGFPYRDFLDWMEVTIAVASERPDVNWLFKAHPCDEWYGVIRGPKLKDLVQAAQKPNLALCEAGWNGRDVINAFDAAVTCHGTIAMEGGLFGKPVLVSYACWLGDGGFTRVPMTRQEYIDTLKSDWWVALDPGEISERAALFAGAYFCVPDWHKGYAFRDDSEQDAIFWDAPDFFVRNAAALSCEVALVRDWAASGAPFYHSYKMLRAGGYLSGARKADYDAASVDPRQRAFAKQ